jgi:hypothetical protein
MRGFRENLRREAQYVVGGQQRCSPLGRKLSISVPSSVALDVTPHVAQNDRRAGGSALDPRTTSWRKSSTH